MGRLELITVFICAVLSWSTGTSANADYKGKLFTIVVGFSPAGGYDTYARVLEQSPPSPCGWHANRRSFERKRSSVVTVLCPLPASAQPIQSSMLRRA